MVANPTVYTPLNVRVQRCTAGAEVDQVLDACAARGLPEGMPFLVSRTSHEVIRPVLEFMAREYLVRLPRNYKHKLKRSPETRKSVIYDLKDFFDFLDAAKIRLADTDEEYVNAYVRSMIDCPCPLTCNPYAAATLKRRYSSVSSFLSWAMGQGIIRHRFALPRAEASPYTRGNPQSSAHLPRGKTIVEQAGLLRLEDKSAHVRVMGFTEMRVVLDSFGPLPIDEAEPGSGQFKLRPTTRDRLMVECGLQTGMRRAEICNLPLATVRAAHLSHRDLSPTAMTKIRIIGKGPKSRTIFIPEWLISALLVYADGERQKVVQAARDANGQYTEPSALFLNSPNVTRGRGNKVSPKTFDCFFRRTQLATQQRLVRENANFKPHIFVVHDLRHTYAVWTYVVRKRQGDTDPIKFVQAQLGHSEMSTTSDLYLAPASAFEATLHDAFATNAVAELRRYAHA